MAKTTNDQITTSRRAVVAGLGVVGVVGSVAACGTASSSDSGATTGGATPGAAGGGGAAVGTVAKVSDIPVGGGKIFDNAVVTQPTAGTFKAFSPICTHQGCHVNAISDGLIKCPCHGSQYSITDGSVKAGPAPKPLPSMEVKVQNGEISIV